MVIKDKVYDVTNYIDYHPGGNFINLYNFFFMFYLKKGKKIMPGIGKDATILFSKNIYIII